MSRERKLRIEVLENRQLLSASTPFSTATAVTLATTSYESLSASVASSGGGVYYKIVAPASGTLRIREAAATNSTLDSYLTIYNSNTQQIASNDNEPRTNPLIPDLNSRIDINVAAGTTYYVKAGGAGSSTGAFNLTFSDLWGKSIDTASAASLSPATGAGSVSGAIANSLIDSDYFSFVAPISGTMTIREAAAPKSPLDSVVSVYDGTKTLITTNNNESATSLNSTVAISVTAGNTYYVRAGAFSTSTGSFNLTFSTVRAVPVDDFGGTFATADANANAVITLDANGNGSKSGNIEQAGDADMMKFYTTVPGHIVVTDTATGALDPVMEVYDANHNLIQRNDNVGTSKNSKVEFDTTARGMYYVKAMGIATSTGQYTIGVSVTPAIVDDYGNTFATATDIPLSTANGYGIISGKIETAGDVDMFSIDAAVGVVGTQITIQETAAPGSLLIPLVTVYDSNGTQVGTQDGTGLANATVSLTITPGNTYYIKAAGSGNSAGAYSVQITSPPPPAPPPDNTYDITLNIAGATAAETTSIQQAAQKWESIITSDLPDVYDRSTKSWIDDLLLNFTIEPIDGVGGILGDTSVDGTRPKSSAFGSGLPYEASIVFDSADVDVMVADGSFFTVALHEMGHAIGFGSIWSSMNLLSGTTTQDPRFIGVNASREYHLLFPNDTTPGVPVEAGGGPGTALSHWRDTLLGSELMTGYLDPQDTANTGWPLSLITVGQMQDLGYRVNYKIGLGGTNLYADPYVAPPPLSLQKTIAATAANARGIQLQTAAALAGWYDDNVQADTKKDAPKVAAQDLALLAYLA